MHFLNKKLHTAFLFFLLCLTLICSANISQATIFDEHIYRRARGYVGFALQASKVKYETNKKFVNLPIIIGAGYNLYFNIYETFHPFVGVEFQGRVPTIKKKYNTIYDNELRLDVKRYYEEVFLAHFKIGARIVLNDKFSVSTYGFVGFNVARIKTSLASFNKIENIADISTGFGGEITINDMFLIALEYRYSKSEKAMVKIDNHNIEAKFGIEIF